jgi:hypothetical protein
VTENEVMKKIRSGDNKNSNIAKVLLAAARKHSD